MDFAEIGLVLDRRLDSLLSPPRAAHSRRVAELAASLCEREGLDPEMGRVAGLAHDMCKEMPRKAQRELAALYPDPGPIPADRSALMADKIVHGPAASAMLVRDYALTDEAILEAVALHTLGKPGMRILTTILYCADKLEPGREELDDEFRRRCLALPLEGMLLRVVEGVIAWMRSRGRELAPETLILYSSLAVKADPR
jgi:predicted HD superfamily hydrolase involved in NAD metabolism